MNFCSCLVSFGPYLPCRENIKLMGAKNNIRPPRPELNMCLLPSLVESSKVPFLFSFKLSTVL